MAYEWYISRSKRSQTSPRITLSKKSIGINQKCVEQYFGGMGFVFIGYDKDSKDLIFIPKQDKTNGAMKLVSTQKSKMSYLKADKLYKELEITIDKPKECSCTWDDVNKGVVVSLQ